MNTGSGQRWPFLWHFVVILLPLYVLALADRGRAFTTGKINVRDVVVVFFLSAILSVKNSHTHILEHVVARDCSAFREPWVSLC